MREIKFRAYMYDILREKNRMYYHKEIKSYCSQFITDNKSFPDRIIMQYTGLKDKNGEEIYEGDICRYKNDNYGQIVFETGAFIFACDTVVDYYKHLYDLIFDGEPYNFSCNLEIIGNIHENNELLQSEVK